MIEFCGSDDGSGRYSNCHEAIYKLGGDERRCDFAVRFVKAKQTRSGGKARAHDFDSARYSLNDLPHHLGAFR
jgi:hypothetical protein